MVAEFRRRRDLLVASLNDIPGFRAALPGGAFYAFPSIAGTGLSSAQLARELLEEAGVAVLPGNSFGAAGEGYLRLSYASSLANLEEAVKRIRRFTERRGCPRP
jgi:aminotransferase